MSVTTITETTELLNDNNKPHTGNIFCFPKISAEERE